MDRKKSSLAVGLMLVALTAAGACTEGVQPLGPSSPRASRNSGTFEDQRAPSPTDAGTATSLDTVPARGPGGTIGSGH